MVSNPNSHRCESSNRTSSPSKPGPPVPARIPLSSRCLTSCGTGAGMRAKRGQVQLPPERNLSTATAACRREARSGIRPAFGTAIRPGIQTCLPIPRVRRVWSAAFRPMQRMSTRISDTPERFSSGEPAVGMEKRDGGRCGPGRCSRQFLGISPRWGCRGFFGSDTQGWGTDRQVGPLGHRMTLQTIL